MTSIEKRLEKYGLLAYYNKEKNKVKFSYNKVPVTTSYAVVRFVKDNEQLVDTFCIGERFLILKLKG